MEKESLLTSLTYMFKDNKFAVKYLVLALLTLLCIIPSMLNEKCETIQCLFISGLGLMVSYITSIFYYGYIAAGAKSLLEQSGNYIIPFFNFKTHGIIGLKCFVASILFGFASGLVVLVAGIVSGIITAVNRPVGLMLIIILCALVGLLILLYYTAFFRMFAITQDIFAFFKIKEIFKSVSDNAKTYFKHIGFVFLLIILWIIIMIVISFLMASILKDTLYYPFIYILVALSGAYLNMVYMYILAKCIR